MLRCDEGRTPRWLAVLAAVAGSALFALPARPAGRPGPVTADWPPMQLDALRDVPGHVQAGPLAPERLALGGGSHRAFCGVWLRWEVEGSRTPLPVRVTLRVPADRPGAPAVRHRWLWTTTPAIWVHTVTGEGETREIQVELSPRHTVELLWVDLSTYRDWSGPCRLVPDPADPHPLGDRRPLVLVHGLLWAGPDRSYSQWMQPLLTRTVLAHPAARGLRRDHKIYAFDYPSFGGAGLAGRELARSVRALFAPGPLPGRRVVLIGHSLGGMVVRRAMNTGDFGDAVRRAFTLASPHHGILIASLARGDARVRNLLGPLDHGLLRKLLGSLVPACPALSDIAWDDHDGSLSSPGLAGAGLVANAELADFNRQDRYLDRLTCVTGDCDRFDSVFWNFPLEHVRRVQARLGAAFANCDPLIPRASGVFDGAPVERVLAPRVNHADWALSRDAMTDILQRVADL